MLTRIKVRILLLHLLFHLFEFLADLPVGHLLAVDALSFSLDLLNHVSFYGCLFFSLDGRCLLLHLGGLNVVFRGLELQVDVGFHAAHLVIWSTLHNVDCVAFPSILDVNGITLVKNRVMRQLILQNNFRVCLQVNERSLMWLYLDECAFAQVHGPDDDLLALLDVQIVHHPDRNVAHALFR